MRRHINYIKEVSVKSSIAKNLKPQFSPVAVIWTDEKPENAVEG